MYVCFVGNNNFVVVVAAAYFQLLFVSQSEGYFGKALVSGTWGLLRLLGESSFYQAKFKSFCAQIRPRGERTELASEWMS